jgi:hypothetical protein
LGIANPLPWWRPKKWLLWHVVILILFFVPLGISEQRRVTLRPRVGVFPLPRANAIEVIRVKAFTGGTKEDRLFDDRSKRIHRVIHICKYTIQK